MKLQIATISTGVLLTLIPINTYSTDDNKSLSYHLTSYFRASRAVVTKNKKLITNAKSELKGLTPSEYAEKFISKTNKRYKRVTSDGFDIANLIKAHLVESIK
jgi:hypothetical protein